MVELLIYPEDQLPPELKCQVLSFLRIVFWDGFTGENRLRDWITHPRFHPLHFLLVEADIGMFHCAPGLKGFYERCEWIAMESTQTYVGARANPVLSQELMMMRFFSAKGSAGRKAFETLPVFFDEDSTW